MCYAVDVMRKTNLTFSNSPPFSDLMGAGGSGGSDEVMKSLIKMKEGVRYVPINTVWYLKLSPGQCQNFKPLRSTNDVSNHNSFENPKSFFTSSVPLHGGTTPKENC